MGMIDFSGIGKLIHNTDKKNAADKIIDNLAASNIGTIPRNSAVGTNNSMDGFSITEHISELLSPSCGMTEDEKAAYMAHIRAKLKNGDKLTGEEMRFLQAEDPVLYMQAARVQSMRDSLEQQLKGAKTKEDAAAVFSQSMSMVSENDPMKEYITAAYEKVYEEYKQTDEYQGLPQHDEDTNR